MVRIPNTEENRQRLLDNMRLMIPEEEFNELELLDEMEDDVVFQEFVGMYSEPEEWGEFSDTDYLSNKELSELEDPPDLLY